MLTERRITAERETDDGFETLSTSLPALVTAAEDLAAERFPSKADREAAKTKPCHGAARRRSVRRRLAVRRCRLADRGHRACTRSRRPGRVASSTRGRSMPRPRNWRASSIDEHGLFGQWRVREQPVIAAMASSIHRAAARDVWVLAEELGGALRPVVFELLGKAQQLARALSSRVTAVLLGRGSHQHAAVLAAHGADRCAPGRRRALRRHFSPRCTRRRSPPRSRHTPPVCVLIPATTMGRDLAPRVAARLQLGLTGDCVDIGLDAQGRLLQYKPAFGGSIVAPIIVADAAGNGHGPTGYAGASVPDPGRPVDGATAGIAAMPAPRARVIARRPTAAAAAELDSAEIVIGVGMGLGDPANFAATPAADAAPQGGAVHDARRHRQRLVPEAVSSRPHRPCHRTEAVRRRRHPRRLRAHGRCPPRRRDRRHQQERQGTGVQGGRLRHRRRLRRGRAGVASPSRGRVRSAVAAAVGHCGAGPLAIFHVDWCGRPMYG